MSLNRDSLLLLAVVSGLLLESGCSGCAKSRQVERDRSLDLDAAAHLDAAAELSVRDAAPLAPVIASAFSLVATRGEFELDRITGGPPVAIDVFMNVVYTLSPEGTITPLRPMAELAAETLGPGFEVGRVTGVWPHQVYVEEVIPGGRDATIIRSYGLDAETGAIRSVNFRDHLATASPWSEDRVLGFAGESSSRMGMGRLTRRSGDFVLLAGKRPAAMPRLPKKVLSLGGLFVSYESGRIFALASVPPKSDDGEYDQAVLCDFPDGLTPKMVKMPGDVQGIARGREERESLVWGERSHGHGYVIRWDGAAWVDVPLPFDDEIAEISTADDGSVWLLSGKPDPRVVAHTKLWRASFPALEWKAVDLPVGHAPLSVVARNEGDVWLTAQTAPEKSVLLHTQSSRPPIAMPETPTDAKRAVLLEKEPAKYSAACLTPFIVLGTEAELSDADVLALVKANPKWGHGGGILARTHSERLYGFAIDLEGFTGTPQLRTAASAALAEVRAKRPSARLVCTLPTIVRELPMPEK